jgi:hypothetical protein
VIIEKRVFTVQDLKPCLFYKQCLLNLSRKQLDRRYLTNCPQLKVRINRPKNGRHRLPNPKDLSPFISGVIPLLWAGPIIESCQDLRTTYNAISILDKQPISVDPPVLRKIYGALFERVILSRDINGLVCPEKEKSLKRTWRRPSLSTTWSSFCLS